MVHLIIDNIRQRFAGATGPARGEGVRLLATKLKCFVEDEGYTADLTVIARKPTEQVWVCEMCGQYLKAFSRPIEHGITISTVAGRDKKRCMGIWKPYMRRK